MGKIVCSRLDNQYISFFKKVRDELVEAIEGKGQVVVINITDSAWATYDIDENLLEWMKENI